MDMLEDLQLSHSILDMYANEKVVLGGDFNCVINKINKRGGQPIKQKKVVIQEMNSLKNTHNLVDTWSFKIPIITVSGGTTHQ